MSILSEKLLSWYQKAKRDLPWRQHADPYLIWVSEIMLQQTRVDTVIPYFERFVQHYPTLQSLAAADETDVLRLWAGLGYYRRAKNLLAGVKEAQTVYGTVPNTAKVLRDLPGVGEYTAGAIASMAYSQPEAAIDGNVERIFARILALTDSPKTASGKNKLRQEVLHHLPSDHPGDFNQALMDLGSLICTPKTPLCSSCPLQAECQGFARGTPERFPIPQISKKATKQQVISLYWQTNGYVLMRKRPDTGLLASLWELPTDEGSCEDFAARYDLQTECLRPIAKLNHIFSHKHWQITLYSYLVPQRVTSLGEWLPLRDLENLPMATVHQKLLKKAEEHQKKGTNSIDPL